MTGSQSQGLGLSLFVSHAGHRQSTVRTYLRPSMTTNANNLHVVTDAWVTKILLEGLRAVGVEFLFEGRKYSIRARKEVQARGMRILLDLVQSPPFQKFDPRPVESPVQACSHLEFLSDPYLECAVRRRMTTNIHPVGTCKMGRSESESVVDQHLKVHGVEGLRVVDASIFPSQISGNPNAAVVMVAERAAQFIMSEHASRF
uniref:Glucose-methanol-choline oxidoreductase C-terminal domain-containing protein n=1 Tax=Romanomermis culicivorax TaxID=13658 RepID=A0A915HYQ4_ROMCU